MNNQQIICPEELLLALSRYLSNEPVYIEGGEEDEETNQS